MAKVLVQHSVVKPGLTLQISQALALAQDAEHRHQQQAQGRNSNPLTHPGIRDLGSPCGSRLGRNRLRQKHFGALRGGNPTDLNPCSQPQQACL